MCIVFGIGFCKLCPVKFIMMPISGSAPGYNLYGVIIAGLTVGIFCMKCVEACPEKGALSLTIFGKEVMTSKRGVEKWETE